MYQIGNLLATKKPLFNPIHRIHKQAVSYGRTPVPNLNVHEYALFHGRAADPIHRIHKKVVSYGRTLVPDLNFHEYDRFHVQAEDPIHRIHKKAVIYGQTPVLNLNVHEYSRFHSRPLIPDLSRRPFCCEDIIAPHIPRSRH